MHSGSAGSRPRGCGVDGPGCALCTQLGWICGVREQVLERARGLVAGAAEVCRRTSRPSRFSTSPATITGVDVPGVGLDGPPSRPGSITGYVFEWSQRMTTTSACLPGRQRARPVLEPADARALDRRELEHLAERQELGLLLASGREGGLVREQPVGGEEEAHLREHVARAPS